MNKMTQKNRNLRTLDTLKIFCSNRSCHKLMGILATDKGNGNLIVNMSEDYLKFGKIFLLCQTCVEKSEIGVK
jgi:hypothetical protein